MLNESELNLEKNGEVELILINLKKTSKPEKLNISFCSLNKVPSVICSFKYLNDLNLSNNCLENLPPEIMFLNNLIWLNLSENRLSSLPKTLKQMQQLTYLNISNNMFQETPDVIYSGLRNLKILDMSFNGINKFQNHPECLNKITELRLSNNSFESLPNWIFHPLCQLQLLDISDNELNPKSKPILSYYNLGIFKSLKILNIENCNYSFENLEFLSYFKNLEVLYLGKKEGKKIGRNYLGNFDINFFKHFTSLKQLSLDNTLISILTKNCNSIKNVEILSVGGNSISWLPEGYCNFGNLKILDLSSNQLLFLPNEIDGLLNLQQIHLQENSLSKLPASFNKLINLEYIDIYNNELEEIDPSLFIFLKKLKGIDLGLNCLNMKKIDIEVYDSLKVAFRNKFGYLERGSCQKPSENIDCNFKSDSSFSASCCDSDSISDSEICVEHAEYKTDEDWDVDNTHETEEEFDPTKISSTLIAPFEANFQYNYCPGNTHVPPLLKSSFWHFKSISKNIPVEEGQFDSD